MFDSTNGQQFKEEAGKWGKYIMYTIGALITSALIVSSLNTVENNKRVVFQNKIFGTEAVYVGPDFYFKLPFASSAEEYRNQVTIEFAEGGGNDDAERTNPLLKISFADVYKSDMPLDVRMPTPDNDNLLKLHKAFGNERNLISSLYVPTIEDVASQSSKQFTAEEIYQGGSNLLKSAIEDQLRDGVLITERKQVQVMTNVASTAKVGENKNSTTSKKKTMVWKAVPIIGKDGVPKRGQNPLAAYGIRPAQTNLAELIPSPELDKLLKDKKILVAKNVTSVQKQINAKTDIETAKLEGEAKRVAAEQEMLIKSDAEIIRFEKETRIAQEVAKKELVERQKIADIAVIDKAKDLQIATANEGIQKANEKAAKYEAQSKLHNGLADAKILKAKYDAYDKTLYSMEIQRDTMINVTKNLQGITVKMPNVNIQGGSENGSSMNSIDTVLQAIGVQKLEEIAKTKSDK